MGTWWIGGRASRRAARRCCPVVAQVEARRRNAQPSTGVPTRRARVRAGAICGECGLSGVRIGAAWPPASPLRRSGVRRLSACMGSSSMQCVQTGRRMLCLRSCGAGGEASLSSCLRCQSRLFRVAERGAIRRSSRAGVQVRRRAPALREERGLRCRDRFLYADPGRVERSAADEPRRGHVGRVAIAGRRAPGLRSTGRTEHRRCRIRCARLRRAHRDGAI
jgi:hypothetical protein